MILKLKRTPGIYLVGFMGCGKSTIGRALADEIGWRFLDLDEEIEKAEKCSISEIFEQRGEPAFRLLETTELRKRVRNIECGQPFVVALGGGGPRVLLAAHRHLSPWGQGAIDQQRIRGGCLRPVSP